EGRETRAVSEGFGAGEEREREAPVDVEGHLAVEARIEVDEHRLRPIFEILYLEDALIPDVPAERAEPFEALLVDGGVLEAEADSEVARALEDLARRAHTDDLARVVRVAGEAVDAFSSTGVIALEHRPPHLGASALDTVAVAVVRRELA